MPELPEVETVRRELDPQFTRAPIARVELRRPDLRAPFPPDFIARLAGQSVTAVGRRAKYLLASIANGDTLVMHLGMSGSFRVAPPATPGDAALAMADAEADPHDHVVFHLADGTQIVFNDPRRFGVMDLLTPHELASHPVISRLGVEPLSPAFDADALARACRGRKVALKVALLDQRVVAGVGNIYACEALHLAQLSPRRRAATIATPAGQPRPNAVRLTAAIKRVLGGAIARSARAEPYRSSPFRVYDREGQRCPRRGCRGTIARRVQAGRSTFYCPACQR